MQPGRLHYGIKHTTIDYTTQKCPAINPLLFAFCVRILCELTCWLASPTYRMTSSLNSVFGVTCYLELCDAISIYNISYIFGPGLDQIFIQLRPMPP